MSQTPTAINLTLLDVHMKAKDEGGGGGVGGTKLNEQVASAFLTCELGPAKTPSSRYHT